MVRPSKPARARIVLSCVLLLSLPTLASAQDFEVPPANEPELRDFALTISPIHLFLPLVELQFDVVLSPFASVGFIGGIGQVTVESEGSLGAGADETTFAAYEVGAQAAFYPVGDVEGGLQLGLEALFLHISSDAIGSESVSGVGSGLALGPLVGYRMVSSGGFTLHVQGGVQFLTLRAEASSDTESESASGNEVIPLLNLNLGYAF